MSKFHTISINVNSMYSIRYKKQCDLLLRVFHPNFIMNIANRYIFHLYYTLATSGEVALIGLRSGS